MNKLTDPVLKKLSDDMESILNDAVNSQCRFSDDIIKQFQGTIQTTNGRQLFVKHMN